MNRLFKILKHLINHPLGKQKKIKTLFRFIFWQIFSCVYRKPIVYKYIGDSKLLVKKSLHSATANMYVGLQEFEEMSFLLHFLDEDDSFCDIGANIGIFTILASKIKKARTHAFEPIESTCYYLKKNVLLNKLENRVKIHKIALSDKKGSVMFTSKLDSENHVSNIHDISNSEIQTEKLDNIIDINPILIKIDVEGYELFVLKGAEKTISDTGLKAIIIEMNNSSNRYNIDDSQIHDYLIKKGFLVYSYYPFERNLVKKENFKNGNNIYIRDINLVKSRIKKAKKIKVYGTDL